MISDYDKSKYLHILKIINTKNANIYTQKELAKYLEVSLRKINSFVNGDIFDFWLLTQYAALLDIRINFWIS